MKNEEQLDLDRLLPGLEPPPPPADLRVRTLAAARERMAAAPEPDLWWRIWNNRVLRLAWAAAVVFLVAGHVVVSPNHGSFFTTKPAVLASSQRDDQFLYILRPVQINADAQPTIGLLAAAADLIQIENGGNPS